MKSKYWNYISIVFCISYVYYKIKHRNRKGQYIRHIEEDINKNQSLKIQKAMVSIAKNPINTVDYLNKIDYEKNYKQFDFEASMFKEKVVASNRTSGLRIELHNKLKQEDEITVERLAEVLNIALEIISITYKENF